MYHRLAKQLSSFFLTEDKKEQEAVVVYGMEMIISTICDLCILIVVAYFFYHVKDLLLFLIFYIPLRQTAGGNHGNSYLSCTVTMFIFTIMLMVIWTTFPLILPTILRSIVLVILCVTILFVAPVEDKHKPLGDKRRKLLKVFSCIVILAEVLIYFFMSSTTQTIITYTWMTQELLLVTGLLKNRMRR